MVMAPSLPLSFISLRTDELTTVCYAKNPPKRGFQAVAIPSPSQSALPIEGKRAESKRTMKAIAVLIITLALTGCEAPKKPALTSQQISQLSPSRAMEWRMK